jgi:hypothetical protein
MIHLHMDKTMSSNVKRALLSGRHVISNIASPFCGHVDDNVNPEEFITGMVAKLRSFHGKGLNQAGYDYYSKMLGPDKMLATLGPVKAPEGVAA